MSASVINTTGHSVTTPGGGGSQTSAYAGTSKAGSGSHSHNATINGKSVSGGANGVEYGYYQGNLIGSNSAKSYNKNVSSVDMKNAYNNGTLSFKDIADYVFSQSVANARNVANYDYRRYKENQRYNARLYNNARDYYTKLADTAVQRRVADLIAAGINPVLAGKFAADTPIVNPYYSNNYPTMQYVDYNPGVASAISYINSLLDYEVGMKNAETNERFYDTDFQSDLARRKNYIVGVVEALLDGLGLVGFPIYMDNNFHKNER